MAPEGPEPRPARWVRALAAAPLPVLHAIAAGIGAYAARIAPFRWAVVRENLSIAFPELDERGLRALAGRFYRGYADVLFEIIKSADITAEDLRSRVTFCNPELVREALGAGRPVLVVAAHQCNWEWLLLAMSIELGSPVDAAYKPLVNAWAEREMYAIRTRFGARLVPAQGLLADLIRRRDVVRVIAIVADQEPVGSEQKRWLRFLNRDSAFFVGPEEIARKFRYASLFVGMRRTGRGRYEVEFKPIAAAGEVTEPGELTARYARLVEAQIRGAPADWPWSHKRWKLRKPLYGP
jgi:KDO2-lipid IV(A) lauroyltransferase